MGSENFCLVFMVLFVLNFEEDYCNNDDNDIARLSQYVSFCLVFKAMATFSIIAMSMKSGAEGVASEAAITVIPTIYTITKDNDNPLPATMAHCLPR